jgi:transcriptional regulator with XRE-family HTH domain
MSMHAAPSPQDLAPGIGHRLRARRKVRGLSLQDVAARADVSVGLLSQIERGITSPSLRSLNAICSALDMPVSWLFNPQGADGASGIVIRRRSRRILDLGGRGMTKELLTPDECTGIQMMSLIIRPGGASGERAHNHPQGAKCGCVRSGALGLEVDGEAFVLEAGDSFGIDARRMIRFWAEGEQECHVIWVVTPALY